jgi:D-alanyl-D-alanine carboxypeptidase
VPWVPGARRVIVRHLLNMASGLYDFADDQAFWDRYTADPAATWRPRQLVRIATAHPAVFPPGREYMYCNTTYVLLGMIIERVTGKTARQVITNRIVRKLGLEHTRFPKATTVTLPAPYVLGYMPADGEPSGSGDLQDISLYSPSAFWTAGAMVSTPGDLGIWLRTIATGRLLSKQTHAAQLRFSTRTPPRTVWA